MQLKTLYTLFYLAVLMFVAKPFIGFSLSNGGQSIEVHSLLAKSFSKRKPDDFEDAEIRAASIHQLLIEPAAVLLLSMASLLAFLFPAVFIRSILTGSFLNNLKVSLIPVHQPYLLTGKLTI